MAKRTRRSDDSPSRRERHARSRPAPRAPASTRRASPSIPPEPAVPEVHGSERAFAALLPAARALAPGDVVAYGADGSLAYHNVVAGVSALLERADDVKRDLPGVDLSELWELPSLAMAVAWAAERVARASAPPDHVAGLLSRARAAREFLLTTAESLARAGLLPARKVAAIREGQGNLDTAQDCVDLANLFRTHAPALRGRSPVGAEHVRDAAAVGAELVGILHPSAAAKRREQARELADAIDARDRLWTLLVVRWDRLWRIGAWLWGREVDRHVPTLQAHLEVPHHRPSRLPPPPPGPDVL